MKKIVVEHTSSVVRHAAPQARSLRIQTISVVKKFTLLLSLASLAAVSANATIWYVDSSATGSKNGTSWANAWSSISSISGVKAGDTVYISGGPTGSSHSYSTSGSWTPAGGSSGNPITYQIGQDSLHNGTAVFSGSSAFVGPASYVVVSGDAGDGGMHFSTSGYGSCVNNSGTTGLRVAYVNFGSSMGDGVDGQGVKSFEFDHNYCMIAGTAVDHFLSCGFNDPTWDGTKIHNNTIYVPKGASSANGADAFQISGSGFSLYNNLISGYNVAWTGGGMQHQDGIQTLLGSYMKIYGNTFQDLANSAVFMDAYYGDFAHIYIYNNVVQITSQADNCGPEGISVSPDGGVFSVIGRWPVFTDVVVINNTEADLNPYGGVGLAFRSPSGTSATYSSCVCANNITINCGSTVIDSSISTSDNLNFTLSANNGDFANYSPLSANNDYDLTSKATSLIKQGANESSYFTTDKNGSLRPSAGAWDIGAYQYGSSGAGPSLTISSISANAGDVDPNTGGLQVYEGTTVQFSTVSSYTGSNTLNWQWAYTVNGGAPVVYQSGSGSIPSVNFNFATGTGGNTYVWTVSATAGTNSASASLTMSVEVPPAPNTSLTFQAPSGTLSGPFTVTGNYISQANTSTTISADGEALYNFTITNAGNYVIQAMVNAPGDAANSFYVNIDAQPVDPTMAWDIFPFTSGFQNVIVSWRGSGSDTNNQYNPKIFNLTTGAHQIIFAGREGGTQLQSFSLLELPATPQNLRILPNVMGNAPNFSAGP